MAWRRWRGLYPGAAVNTSRRPVAKVRSPASGIRRQAARLAACAIIAFGLAMIVTSTRPLRPLPMDVAGPEFTSADLRDVRQRTLAAAAWMDRVMMINGTLLIVLGIGWLVRMGRRPDHALPAKLQSPAELRQRVGIVTDRRR